MPRGTCFSDSQRGRNHLVLGLSDIVDAALFGLFPFNLFGSQSGIVSFCIVKMEENILQCFSTAR
jgi:hypothetical protein